jgi:methionyl-tRNA formyltransferase
MTPSTSNPQPGRKLKILLIGYGPLGWALLKGLLACRDTVEITGVFPWSNRPKYRQYRVEHEIPFVKLIRKHRIPEIKCKGVNHFSFMPILESQRPDVLLIGSWGEILKKPVLEFPGLTVINCHPSKLPAHRGSNPYASAIRMGETETGVTFHLVNEGIDTGAVLLQETLPILPDDTGVTLRERATAVAESMVPGLIHGLLAGIGQLGGLMPIAQDESLQSYFPAIGLEDGRVFWEQPAQAVYNQIRGLQPWLDAFSFVNGHILVSFNQAVLIPQSQPLDYPPGLILGNKKGCLWVASSDPHQLFRLSGIRFFSRRLGQHLPFGLSTWISLVLCRPGNRLIS